MIDGATIKHKARRTHLHAVDLLVLAVRERVGHVGAVGCELSGGVLLGGRARALEALDHHDARLRVLPVAAQLDGQRLRDREREVLGCNADELVDGE